MAYQFQKEYELLQKALKLDNFYAVPKLKQVSVNVGVGKNRDNKAHIKAVKHDLELITGQHPHERRARKAVAGFNVRQDQLVGYHITLRGKRMEDFVKRFVNVVLPRVKDFRGIPLTVLDGRGNLSYGLNEQLSFPEVNPEKTDIIFSLQVTFVTTAPDNKQGEELFSVLGFPFTKEDIEDSEISESKQKQKNKS